MKILVISSAIILGLIVGYGMLPGSVSWLTVPIMLLIVWMARRHDKAKLN